MVSTVHCTVSQKPMQVTEKFP